MQPHDIPIERLIDLAEGRLSAEESAELRTQLQHATPDTAARWAWVQGFASVSNAIDLSAPPDSVRENVLATLRAKTKRPSLLKRITALLTFDSWQQPDIALAGARSTVTKEPRQLFFTTEDVDISLEIDAQTVSGQILGAVTDEWYTIALFRGGREVATTTHTQLGEFSIPDVADGEYVLVITSAEQELILAPITV